MRERPVRAQLYEPNIRFGIEDRDWFVIGAITLLPFIALFALDTFIIALRIYYTPIYVFITPATLIGSVLFFRTIHIDKPGHWFEHNVLARLEAPVQLGVNPGDRESVNWLLTDTTENLPSYQNREAEWTPLERVIRESNRTGLSPIERLIAERSSIIEQKASGRI